MTDLVLERIFAAPIDTVFDYISKEENLLKWWGPEGMHVPEGNLEFSRKGTWYSVMQNAEGKRFKVSGQVTKVSPPNLVAFTWGWHDEEDARGHESHVMIELEGAGEGQTRLTLAHRDLADDESAANHNMGWTSSLRKLEVIFA